VRDRADSEDHAGRSEEHPLSTPTPDATGLELTSLKLGTIEDYVSGLPIKATPEELEAVQVMSRRLVEDYGYSKGQLQTRPQHRVRRAPSDAKKSYPVDIAVFKSDSRHEDDLHILVECKRKQRKDGLQQLKLYMDMSAAEFGVWFNGDDHEYVRKVLHEDGSRTWETLPNIPRQGEAVEDIGLHRRQDLTPPSNLRAVFKDLRNHLAGNLTGITRDEALAAEIINLLFCKIYDEVNTNRRDLVSFRWGHNEPPVQVEKRILALFEQVKIEYPDVFSDADVIRLDPESMAYVVGELQPYAVTEADRDAIGDAFEVFIGPALRGGEGQFFTPRNVVKAVVEMLDPKPGETVIDPACGSGGFLTVALEHVWQQQEAQAADRGWSPAVLERLKREVATRTFRGIDKDSFLAKVTKAYMAIIGDGRGGVFCENTLLPPEEWQSGMGDRVKLGSFDVVLTNPPFGKKIRITGQPLLRQYDMGHKWKLDRASGERELTEDVHSDQPPQLLFLERCLQLLKPGGRLGIVLPESILGNPSYSHVLPWLRERAQVRAVVALPEALFKTSGSGGTHTKVCVLVVQKLPAPPAPVLFMADVKWCGHDSRGNPTLRKLPDGSTVLLDEVPEVVKRFQEFESGELDKGTHLGFGLRQEDTVGQILIPKYYDPELKDQLSALGKTHDLIWVGDLLARGALSITTGIEVGKMAYGTGDVPFIRTSDLSNWELKADPKHGVSDELYEELRHQCDVEEGDILMVRDGTYLVGTSAVVSQLDTKMLYQSHLLRIRVTDPTAIDPWLLFAALNSPIVKRQIRAKRFTQDIIDTLGNRLQEVVVPVPRDAHLRASIASRTREAVQTRAELRERARLLALEVEGLDFAAQDLLSLDEAD
jgi:type I restriction enzyme M protein